MYRGNRGGCGCVIVMIMTIVIIIYYSINYRNKPSFNSKYTHHLEFEKNYHISKKFIFEAYDYVDLVVNFENTLSPWDKSTSMMIFNNFEYKPYRTSTFSDYYNLAPGIYTLIVKIQHHQKIKYFFTTTRNTDIGKPIVDDKNVSHNITEVFLPLYSRYIIILDGCSELKILPSNIPICVQLNNYITNASDVICTSCSNDNFQRHYLCSTKLFGIFKNTSLEIFSQYDQGNQSFLLNDNRLRSKKCF